MGLRAIAVLGLAAIPLNHAVLKRLLGSSRRCARATRSSPRTRTVCRRSPGLLLTLQLLSLVIDAIAKAVSIPGHPIDLDTDFSINGWLAVLLTFLLARVFAEGTLMRDDLEGTV